MLVVVGAIGVLASGRSRTGAPPEPDRRERRPNCRKRSLIFITAISFLIGVLMVVVVRAICFVLIERFVRDARLANLLKLLLCSMLGRHCAETRVCT